MITRSLTLRHGRTAIPKSCTASSIRQWRQALSSTSRQAAQEQQQDSRDGDNALGPQDSISADWAFFQHQRSQTKSVGAAIAPHYKPANLVKRPPRPEDITLELLLASQTHLGHRTSLWHPGNARYIFGTWGQAHDAIHVISLDVTAAHLRRACKIVSGVAAKGGVILFVGTRDGQATPVVRAAEMAGGFHLFDKWTPGTLTNGQQILGRCATKVVNEVDEEVLGFGSQLKRRPAIKPDLVVCLNPRENYILLHECGIHGIPTIGIIDTDVNPTWVTYPIPANDDSLRSVGLIAGALGRAGEAGHRLRLQRARAGEIDFTPATDLELPTKQEVQAAKRAKDRLAEDDKEYDEEDDMLTPEEEAMYAPRDVGETKQNSSLESAEEDDTFEASQESDETLVSLTNFSEDKSVKEDLSSEDLAALAASVQHDSAKGEPVAESELNMHEEPVADAVPVETTPETTAEDRTVSTKEDIPITSEDAVFSTEAAVTPLDAAETDATPAELYEDAVRAESSPMPAETDATPAELYEDAVLAESPQIPRREETSAVQPSSGDQSAAKSETTSNSGSEETTAAVSSSDHSIDDGVDSEKVVQQNKDKRKK